MQPDIVLLNHFVLCSICLVVYVYTICMHTPLGVNMSFCVCVCVYAQVCVCLLNADGSTSWWPTAGKRERGWESGRTDKKECVQSSEADDCVFVRVNLFITDATEISIEMILVTDFALDISDGRHPNVYVYRTGAGSAERDAGMRKSDG